MRLLGGESSGPEVFSRQEAAMSEHEHEQQSEETADEREETMKDLDVPEEESGDVTGGVRKAGDKDPGY
jgi:hypothetical protein